MCIPTRLFVQYVCFISCVRLSQLPNRPLSLLFPLVQVDCDRFLRVSSFRFCVIARSLLGSPRLICFEVTPFVEGVPPGPSLVASQGSLFRSLGIGVLTHTSVIFIFPYPLSFVCLRVWLLAFRLQRHKLFGWFLVGREAVFFFFLRRLRAGGRSF